MAQLPTPELAFYGSDLFLQSASAEGVRDMRLNSADINEVIRLAMASDTIPNLGGIALLGQTELEDSLSAEVAAVGQAAPPGTQLQEQIMLNELAEGSVRDRKSLSQAVLGLTETGRSLLYFATEPDERKIAEGLYDAATLAGVKNDEWFSSTIMGAGPLLRDRIGGNLGRLLGDAVTQFGQGVPQMRKAYDRQLLRDKHPVLLVR